MAIADTAQMRHLVGALINALPDAVIVVDGSDRVLALNPAAKSLFATLRPADYLARGLRAPEVLDLVQQVRGRGVSDRAGFGQRVPVERFFEVNAAPLQGTSAVVLHLRDLSEARRLERTRVDFVANASHELRTPLASLLGFVETLQGAARDDAVVRGKFLAVMREQATRMARLVDDLLSLSRIEQHQHLAPSTPVELAALIRHITDTLSPLAHDNDVVLTIEGSGPLVVTADRDELMRVIENLVENAIKYGRGPQTADQARVDIKIEAQADQAHVSVRDYGPGIDAEHIPRLTERFYRVDATQSRAKGGTGLGLAIVKHIMARHRGRLTIESQRGAGSVFTITLPLHKV